MSKRRGDFVTLDELIERIGVDATRWFMLSRSHDSTIDLDLELAAKQDPENPVYYVQYDARADRRRSCAAPATGRVDAALARRARRGGAQRRPSASWSARLLAFPGEVREAVERRAPHRIASYALELGQAFAAFYRDSPVLDEPDEALQSFRIALCVATQRTLAARARPARRVGPGVDVMLTRLPRGLPAPYIHADNRGLVLCNGPQCVLIPASQLRAVRGDVRDHRRRGPRDPRAGPARGRRLRRPAARSCSTPAPQDHLLSVTVSVGRLHRAARGDRASADEGAARRPRAAAASLAAPGAAPRSSC